MRSSLNAFYRYFSPAARETTILFGVDTVTNGIDYAFHVFLGRVLEPGDFATVQTVNSGLLILLTSFGVLQPVVARFVAEAEAQVTPEKRQPALASRGVFQRYFRYGSLLGLLLVTLGWLLRGALAEWLNVPTLAAVLLIATIPLALLRPVVAGMLQGQGRTIAFGLTRTAHALSRFAVAGLALGLGGGVLGVIGAFPAGSLLALLAGLVLVGMAAWQSGSAPRDHLAFDGLRLSAGALVAYAAYMVLLNNDLIWVNRSFAPEAAGSYATAVLLRRVLALMPGAVIVIMFPRAVAKVTRRELPDSLLIKTAGVVLVSTLALTLVYFAAGSQLIELAFGIEYVQAGPLLGWMGAAMIGYGVASIWLNFYLATRPVGYIILLVITAAGQHLLLSTYHATLGQVTGVFLASGWALALGGLAIYLLVLRPQLVANQDRIPS